MCDKLSVAVAKCPFLSKVADSHGLDYARSIAVCPTAEVGTACHVVNGPESAQHYEASFRLFHGPDGVIPLVRPADAVQGTGCPFHAQLQAAKTADPKRLARAAPFATISLSFGSGPNFGDFLRKQLHKGNSKSQRPSGRSQQPASSQDSGSRAPKGPGSSQQPGKPNGPGNFRPQRPLTDPNSGCTGPQQRYFGTACGPNGASALSATGSGTPSSHGPFRGGGTCSSAGAGVNNTAGINSKASLGNGTAATSYRASASTANCPTARGAAPAANTSRIQGSINVGYNRTRPIISSRSSKGTGSGAAKGGANGNSWVAGGSSNGGEPPSKCPLRKWLGPMAGLVFNEYDKLVCPPPILAARAALAKTAAVQQLRPQKLPIKLVAVAAVSAAANIPCGAVREHFEKFSLGWFVAVHATIPFVAMLRKAVIMPKYVILVTIAAAVMGQVVGSRLERIRMQQQQPVDLAAPAAAASLQLLPASVAGCDMVSTGNEHMQHGRRRPQQRSAGWRQKLLAGGTRELADTAAGVDQAAASAGNCSKEVSVTPALAVIGLGKSILQLPVLRA